MQKLPPISCLAFNPICTGDHFKSVEYKPKYLILGGREFVIKLQTFKYPELEDGFRKIHILHYKWPRWTVVIEKQPIEKVSKPSVDSIEHKIILIYTSGSFFIQFVKKQINQLLKYNLRYFPGEWLFVWPWARPTVNV